MNEIKEGYNFKLFSNSVHQVTRQDIYGQHLMLDSFSIQSDDSHLSVKNKIEQHEQEHMTELLSTKQHQSQQYFNYLDNDLQPRSLNTNSNWTNSNCLISSEKASKNTIAIQFKNNNNINSINLVNSNNNNNENSM
jgi:hypothetical protein